MLCNSLVDVLPNEIGLDHHRKRSGVISCTRHTVSSTWVQGSNISSQLAIETRNPTSLGESNLGFIEPPKVISSPHSVEDVEGLINFIQLELVSRESRARLLLPERKDALEKRKHEGTQQSIFEDKVHLQTLRAWITTNRRNSIYVPSILERGS